MDIIQVIIFIIIIVAAIVQQISKTGKEKKTPSPKKVLADIFPEIEQENIEEDLPVSSVQTVRTPQTPRMQHQPMVKKPTDSPRKENKREDRTPPCAGARLGPGHSGPRPSRALAAGAAGSCENQTGGRP